MQALTRRRLIATMSALGLAPRLLWAATDELVVGISAALSGPEGNLGRGLARGLTVCFSSEQLSRQLGGRRVRLVQLDDGYRPDDAARQMQALIDEHRVLAVLANMGTSTAQRTVPIANREQVPFLGPLSGAEFLRIDVETGKPHPYVFNLRAAYAEETRAMVHHCLEVGVRPNEIAFFRQDDAFGDAGLQGALSQLRSAGYRHADRLVDATYVRSSTDVDSAILAIMNARVQPRAIICVATLVPAVRFTRLMRPVLPHALYLNVSPVNADQFLDEMGPAGEGVVVTQVVPHPGGDTAAAKDFQRDLASTFPDRSPDFVSFEGYLVGRLFVEAARRAGPGADRESIRASLEQMSDFDLGIGVDGGFKPEDHQFVHTVWPTIIRNGRIDPMDWSELRGLLEH